MRNKVTALILFAAIGIAAGRTTLAKQTDTQDNSPPQGRILHFPPDRPVGNIYLQDADFQRKIKTFHYWIPDYEKWDYYCAAKGDVRIPAGKRVKLITKGNRKPDPKDLSKLQPDDLHTLVVQGRDKSVRADDSYMDAVGRLTGLKVLDICYSNITSRGLSKIRNCAKLEQLSLSDWITDSGMPVVASLKSLKALHLTNCRITDAGLAKICENLSLEELELGDKKLRNEGLAHLSKMGTLKYLRIYGDNFTDAGMAHLKNVSSLRILHAGSLMMITDEGLKHLSEHPLLERITFHHNRNITNEGARYLGRMRSLKMLDVRYSQIDDVGVGYLCKNKALEYLELPHYGITDVGLKHLSTIDTLKVLRIPRTHYIDPKMDVNHYTDEGLRDIGKLSELEGLNLGGLGVTDAGMEHVAKLTKLKQLMLFGCPVTDKGFEKLAALKSLEDLFAYKSKMTMSGLKCLNELTNLKRLTLEPVIRDNSVMDLSGLKNLQYLSIRTPRKSEDFLTDADLACLENLEKLRDLSLAGCDGITDKGLMHLKGLTNVERLHLIDASLTDDGLAYLKDMKKLNHLQIGGNFTEYGLQHLKELKALKSLYLYPKSPIPHRAVIDLKKSLPFLSNFQMQTK
jgi:Leucine-rich repeat (LRR) protein